MKISSFLFFMAVAGLTHGAAVLPNHDMMMRAKRDILEFSNINALDCIIPIGDNSACQTAAGAGTAFVPPYGGSDYSSGSGGLPLALPGGGSTAVTPTYPTGSYGGYGAAYGGFPGFYGAGYGGYGGFPGYGYGGGVYGRR